jgi:hypothetical protein
MEGSDDGRRVEPQVIDIENFGINFLKAVINLSNI